MQIPVKITFRHMPFSDAIEAEVRKKAAKLDLLYDRIMGCHVVIEAPHQHHHQGKIFNVRIDMSLPQGELVVNRDSGLNHAHEDVYVAIRDAFNAMKRQLQDYIRRHRLQVKAHEPASRARITKLFPYEGYGFIETGDGREIYFHKNSVIEGPFDRLEVGSEVIFTEEMGQNGPQASTVRLSH